MGILDEAIREHLELKRQHGADENELQGLEDEAFGQADRPDATGPSASAEAETQIISPGSSVTSPAGEGDQLDKVFESSRQAESGEAGDEEAQGSMDPEATFAEHPIPEPPAPAEAQVVPKDEPKTEAEPEATDQATVESPEAKPAEPEPEPVAEETPAEEGDAGDMLEAERHHLASHPTEHYDVDAAIAEEDEIDVLSESSLSDELDRALDSGEVASAGETVEYDSSAEPDSGEIDLDEPESAEIDIEDSAELDPETDEDSASDLYQDAAPENQPVEEDPDTDEEEAGQADFFDQDDPLEGTPDFLEETPEHDQLWFEQKQPKDFDFGD